MLRYSVQCGCAAGLMFTCYTLFFQPNSNYTIHYDYIMRWQYLTVTVPGKINILLLIGAQMDDSYFGKRINKLGGIFHSHYGTS